MVSCKIKNQQKRPFSIYTDSAIGIFDEPPYKVTSITLKQIEVNDIRIFDLIDTVLQSGENCFFVKDNQPIRHIVCIYGYNNDTLIIRVGVEQYDEQYYFEQYYLKQDQNIIPNHTPYFFYYRGKCFFAGMYDYLVSKFFKITDIEKEFNIKFNTITNYYTHYPYFSDECSYRWFYINDNFYNNFKKDCVPDSVWLNPNIDRYKNGEKLKK